MHPIITLYEAELLVEERLRVAERRRRHDGGARPGVTRRRPRLRTWLRSWADRPAPLDVRAATALASRWGEGPSLRDGACDAS